MAKLTRTLGENVPPELVFRQATLAQPPKRRSSLSFGRSRASDIFTHKSSKSVAPAVPVLPVAEVPVPPPRAVEQPQTKGTESKKRPRPRSLTLGSASAHASAATALAAEPTRGTMSLDVRREQPFAEAAADTTQKREVEVGTRRKEREWSGEWNMQNMEDVTKALRCLKGR